MSFIVIEGDNGTGKDTLAQNIKNNLGYRIITDEPNIKKMNIKAKKLKGKRRIKKFLKYGKKCSKVVYKSKENVILVRYWISTLAAAYADGIYTYKQVCRQIDKKCKKFCKPDMVFCLWCNFEDRIERIKLRQAADFDDITKQRALKYIWILKELQQTIETNWIDIDTTNKSKEQVYKEVCKYIN